MSNPLRSATGALDARVRSIFLSRCVRVSLAQLVPMKTSSAHAKQSAKYQQIVASVREVGLIEPPAVIPISDRPGYFHILDGHLRVEALRDLDVRDVDCMLATEDDTYSYNRRVVRLGALQEHAMVMRAWERGVSPERIADALGIRLETLRTRFRVRTGICDEAITLLANEPCPAAAFDFLRRMNPIRQIEAAELMVGQKNFSAQFVQAILMATPETELVAGPRDRQPTRACPNSMARLEREVTNLQIQNRTAEDEYGPDVLKLMIARSYLASLLANSLVANWLTLNRPEYLKEFQRIGDVPGARIESQCG